MNDVNLQQLLHDLPPDLSAPTDRFEQVMRRARRRHRQRVLGSAGGAVAVVAAIAVAVASLTAGGPGGTETITPAGTSSTPTPTASASPTAGATVRATQAPGSAAAGAPRFIVTWASFVSAEVGYAWGPGSWPLSDQPTPGVLAVTRDGGRSWQRVPGNPPDYDSGTNASIGRLLFRDADHGFLYGDALYDTSDGGRTWSRLPTPGRISDLRIVDNHLLAVVEPCQSGCPSEVYTGPLTSASLTPVAGPTGDLSRLTVRGERAFVISSPGDTGKPALLWMSDRGSPWNSVPVPCTPVFAAGAALAAWGDAGLAVVCGGEPGAGQQPKTAYVSTDNGAHWTSRGPVNAWGYVGQLVALDAENWVLTADRGTITSTHDGGRTWTAASVAAVPQDHAIEGWYQLELLGSNRLIALPATMNGNLVAISNDRGDTWSTVLFSPAK